MNMTMKHFRVSILLVAAAAILISSFSFHVSAAFPLRVVVNNEKIAFPDAQPYLDENDRTMVPVRFVSEALGADVKWDGKTEKVTITKGSIKAILQIGKKSIEVNGKAQNMDTVAVKKEGRTIVPVRFVSQALGAEVEWDEAVSTVYITTGGTSDPKPGGTENVGGFTVPLDTDLLVVEDNYGGDRVVSFEVNLLRADVERQIEHLADILSQKCDQATVDTVVAHIKKKKERFDLLEEFYMLDKKSDRYIYIFESKFEDISIMYYIDEIK
ncbi:copper amine oxidase N-terminal domain-containing protein [Paenibacillus soyae]|uniref:Copper amine oxidase N-terminal domain-containing protein n=1 Tax=Paenibacillus soyae TaxID=2969249 RepID=A0A9X2S7J2_9BACL|nr:copper amine oxidase N-terminal domain-containing protein [Paenibacillus soyae]MCR2803389.1 copper amine oxidase N-terminal domain-containing protein [Paenibacillus soyae]